jgi:hypothetical protein
LVLGWRNVGKRLEMIRTQGDRERERAGGEILEAGSGREEGKGDSSLDLQVTSTGLI